MRRALVLAFAVAGCAHPIAPPVAAPKLVDPERVPFSDEARAAELTQLGEAIRSGYSHLETKRAQWGVDLDGLLARYLPLARRADTWDRYERVMVAFASEFHDAHLAWRRQRAAPERRRRIVRLGLATRFVAGALYVSEVWPGSGAERAGLRVGDRIVAVDGDTVEQAMGELGKLRSWSRLEDARYDFAEEWPAARVDQAGTPPERLVTRELADGSYQTIRVAPETEAPPGYKKEAIALEHHGAIALLRLRSLGARPAELAKKLDEIAALLFAAPHGAVIDLRGNPGGYDEGSRAVASRLSSVALTAGEVRVRLSPRARQERAEWRTLAKDPARPGWSLPQPVRADGGAKQPYPAKLVVLIDAGCRSACESLTLLLHALGARLVGERTGGSSGAPISVALPTSGARVTIPAWAMFDGAGHPIEGRGVAPDEELLWTRDDLVGGRDPVLQRALDLVAAP